ncbi:MAG: hypothetical protein CME06_03890 [Gemmatimonadetes bacterium]|nr:hypothetical protein [Gemmatimonadota bacterium]
MSRSLRLDLPTLDAPTSVFRIEADRVEEREGPRLILPVLTTRIDLESGLPHPEPAPVGGLPVLHFHRSAEALARSRRGIFLEADAVRLLVRFFAADVAMRAVVLLQGGDALLTDEKITVELGGRGEVLEARFREGSGSGHELGTAPWVHVRRIIDAIGPNRLLINRLEDR